MSEALLKTTYSMWRLFRNCRKACEWRYVNELVPLQKEHSLLFGSFIHKCLEIWHQERELHKVLDYIDRECANRAQDEKMKQDWHLATAMMKGYVSRYPSEEFEIVSLEKKFEGKIINPATGAASRSFTLAGRIDGIVKMEGQYYLLENKTAANIDAGYLERLWTDFQIIIYAWYAEQALGIHITGILYNILVKAKLKQSKGETEGEYEERKAGLIAKSKTGKSSAKRKMPETDEEFHNRLIAKYAEDSMFHREPLFISRDQFETLQSELWELCQAFLDARRRNVFYQNTAFCYYYNRPCAYYPLCSSNGNPNVIENHYQKVEVHEELRDEEPQSTPSF